MKGDIDDDITQQPPGTSVDDEVGDPLDSPAHQEEEGRNHVSYVYGSRRREPILCGHRDNDA